jgi:hypothetical protein
VVQEKCVDFCFIYIIKFSQVFYATNTEMSQLDPLTFEELVFNVLVLLSGEFYDDEDDDIEDEFLGFLFSYN